MPPSPGRATRGHRIGPHTADCVIEAWGPDRCACLTEALRALVEIFAEAKAAAGEVPVTQVPLCAEPGPDIGILVALLEEVIYTTDVIGVPVRFQLWDADDGGVRGFMEVAAHSCVEQVGPIPKAVSYHEIEIGPRDGAWRCRAVIDV